MLKKAPDPVKKGPDLVINERIWSKRCEYDQKGPDPVKKGPI